MLRRLIGASALVLLWALTASAQVMDTGAITAQDAGSCATPGACAVFAVPAGAASVTIQVTGTYTGATLHFDTSSNGGTLWTPDVKFADIAAGTNVATTTANGSFVLTNSGLTHVRVRAAAFSTGTATITAARGAGAGSSASVSVGTLTASGALTNDPDDGSIAAAQTNDNVNALGMIFDGTVWRRHTLGTAGTAAAQVQTIQGIASMTPVQVSQATAANLNATVVQATGSNLHTVCDSGCSGSTFADNAAFTFGTTVVSPIAGVLDDTSSNAATENSAAVVRITSAKGLHINLRNAAGTEIGTSTTPVQVSLANTGANTTPVGANITQVSGATQSATNPLFVELTNGTTAIAAATGGAGTVDSNTTRAVLATDQTAIPIGATSVATNAATGCYIISAASNNASNCKASAGNFYGVRVVNTTTTTYYLRLYNLATSPTCSSGTGFIETIPIPPAASSGQAGGIMALTPLPIQYSAGVGYCLTAGASSTDNTSAATGIYGAVYYK